jgi:uncharacterized protein DUF3617
MSQGYLACTFTTRWITAVVVVVLMAVPGVSAQSFGADRAVRGDCGAVVASAAQGLAAGAPTGTVGMRVLKPHLTLAGPVSRVPADTPPNLRPGQYEAIVEGSVPGSPVKMPPQTNTVCVDPKNFATKPPVPSGQDCTVSEYKSTGNKATFVQTCKGSEGITTRRGEVTFAGESYAGVMETKFPSGRTLNIKWTAKRIGDCPK